MDAPIVLRAMAQAHRAQARQLEALADAEEYGRISGEVLAEARRNVEEARAEVERLTGNPVEFN